MYEIDNKIKKTVNAFIKCEKALPNLIDDLLNTIDKYIFNGLFCTDTFSSILTSAKEIPTAEGKYTYFRAFFQRVIHHPAFFHRYADLLRHILSEYSLSRELDTPFLKAYFTFIDINEWFTAWNDSSIEEMKRINFIKHDYYMYHSEDMTEVGYALGRTANEETLSYFIACLNESTYHFLVTELLRNVLAKKGSYSDTQLLKNALLSKGKVHTSLSDELDNFLKHNHLKAEHYDFLQTDMSCVLGSLTRSQPHTLRYAVKLARLTNVTDETLIQFVNKSKSKKTSAISIALEFLRLTPYDLLQHPQINTNGKRVCLNLIS